MTEQELAIAAGLTDQEAECWELSGLLARHWFQLPKLHPMDDHEVTHAIHVIQNKLLGRPAYRKYLKLAYGQGQPAPGQEVAGESI